MARPATATGKRAISIPASGGEAGLNRYLTEIKKFPILTPEDEFRLATQWREQGDTDAAARLVNSHLRLVAKIAMGYRGYGLPVSELISEGNIGLIRAAELYNPKFGTKFTTYASVWIKQRIHRAITSQARAVRALASVSCVVNVFEQTMNSVAAGSMPRVASAKSVPSTFETKRTSRSRRL